MAQSVLAYIRKHELLKPGDRLGAAVSGGADSVAMLRLLLELRQEMGIVLSVVHFNHKLRGTESDADEQFVAELARRHELWLHCASGEVAHHAAEKHWSLETAARDMRYGYFKQLLSENCMDRIATAHTLDDQAETVLMKVARGAGTRGLAGIYPKLAAGFDVKAIIRPLLSVRRKELEAYLKSIGQDWREDASNRDLRHTRNRVRHGILPRLEKTLNPAVCEALAETAEIARAEEEYWEQEVRRRLPEVWSDSAKTFRLKVLQGLPLAVQRRMIRAAAESLRMRLEFRQVEEILEVGVGKTNSTELLDGWRVERVKENLQFTRAEAVPSQQVNDGYEYRLPVPGSILVPEAGARLEAVLISGSASAEYNPDNLLDPEALAAELTVRNWRAGDRFWPAHSKAPKKIKELLLEKHIIGPVRRSWPVLVSGGEIIWVRGFAAPAKLCSKNGARGVLIKEIKV